MGLECAADVACVALHLRQTLQGGGLRWKLWSELVLAEAGEVGFLAEVVLVRKVLVQQLSDLLCVPDLHVLGHQASQGVDDGAVPCLVVVLAVLGVPLVAVDLEEGLGQELRPELVVVTSTGQDWLPLVAARHAVIDLYESLLAHEPQLDPVLACW